MILSETDGLTREFNLTVKSYSSGNHIQGRDGASSFLPSFALKTWLLHLIPFVSFAIITIAIIIAAVSTSPEILGCKLPEGARLRNYRVLKAEAFRHIDNTAAIHGTGFKCRLS
jgi:hypothetical protein